MNVNKICFIMCVNNERCAQESLYYIEHLRIPEGYETQVLLIRDAKSMAAGYNQGMRGSDAKYKIYLHQDVMIVEKDFLFYILDIFGDSGIGMIGMMGSVRLPENAVMWYQDMVGRVYTGNTFGLEEAALTRVEGEYQQVEAVDGLLIATQYDMPWREDLFDKWDFYDVSQSFEFRKRGYNIVVPAMESPWCIHDGGVINTKEYWGQRKKFITNYMNEKRI